MRSRFIVALLLFTPTASFAQEPNSDDEVYKAIKPSGYIKFAPSGEPVKIDGGSSISPKCTSNGKVFAKVLKQPANGTISEKIEDSYSSFNDSNPRSKCNSIAIPSTSVYYKSNEGFIGHDEAHILLIYPNGQGELSIFNILVR